jgi:hypothetical protein
MAKVQWYVKREVNTASCGAENALRSPPFGRLKMRRGRAPDWASYNRHAVGLLVERRDFGPNLSEGCRYALRESFWLLEKIIVGRDLRVGVVVSEFNGMRDFAGRWIMASGLPDPKMLQNLLDDRLVLDDADHPHFALAFWAY